MTTTSWGCSVPSVTASIAPCSPSKTRAVPSKTSASKPADLTTAPSGASDPRRIVSPPVLWIGWFIAWVGRPAGGGRGDLGEVPGQRPAGDGEHVAVQQPGVQQRPHDHRHAADP